MACNMDNSTFLFPGNDSLFDVNVTDQLHAIAALHVAQRQMRLMFIAVYMITFVFGCAGNIFVIYIIGYFSAERIKSVANYYIWSLAFADLLFVLSLPVFCLATYLEHWPFEGVVASSTCKIAYFFRNVTKFASAWNMVALSVDRCLASYYNTQNFRTVKSGKLVICCIWSVSFLLSIYYFVYANTFSRRCKLDNDTFGYIWAISQLIIGYILPSLGILTAYCVLWRRMRQRLSRRSSNLSNSYQSHSMTRTVFVVAVTFTLCQTPYHISQIIWTTTAIRLEYAIVVIYINAVSQILIYFASCCNPIIYGLLNHNYRRLYGAGMMRCFTQSCCCSSGCLKPSDMNTVTDHNTSRSVDNTRSSVCQNVPHLNGNCTNETAKHTHSTFELVADLTMSNMINNTSSGCGEQAHSVYDNDDSLSLSKTSPSSNMLPLITYEMSVV